MPSPTRGASRGVPPGEVNAHSVLRRAQAGRVVIEDYRPLAASIEWRLGQRYFREHGANAFISDTVPFVINNDGTLSAAVAEIFFESLLGAEASGTLEPDIFALSSASASACSPAFFSTPFALSAGAAARIFTTG